MQDSKRISLSDIKDLKYNPCDNGKRLDPLFYIPFREHFPELDILLEKHHQKNGISFLYVEPKEGQNRSNKNDVFIYPLETMFECYKDAFPNYEYEDFKVIVKTELNSMKSDDEVMEYFIETFGYGAIDFLQELIRNRRKKIDYGSTVFGKSLFQS